MTIAIAHVGKNAGRDGRRRQSETRLGRRQRDPVGEKGFAYVVDDRGRLIAHPDFSLVLRDTDLSHLPQVATALADAAFRRNVRSVGRFGGNRDLARRRAGTDRLCDRAEDALGGIRRAAARRGAGVAYRSLARSLALLGLGLLLAAVSGVALARRMAARIRLLQAGAERLGAGDLAQRLDIRTGDEIEALAGSFNRMAGSLQESYETLEAKVEARTKDLNELLAQQTATADVLKVISRSAFDLEAVLDTLSHSAVRLSGAAEGVICARDGDTLRLRAGTGQTKRRRPVPGSRSSGRAEYSHRPRPAI